MSSIKNLRPSPADGFIEVALRRAGASYRRARETMAAAYPGGGHAAFEGWRRAVHDHALHFGVLAGRSPGGLAGRQELLGRLEELLGQDHDLRLFAGASGSGQSGADPALVEQRHRALRALARPLGRRLFAEPPAAFARRLQRCLAGEGEGEGQVGGVERERPALWAVAA